MRSHSHVLDLAKDGLIKKFLPSSIAVFGPTTPKENTPQYTIMGQTRFTELPNKLEKGGTNITLTNLE